jgi:hypothetical protein
MKDSSFIQLKDGDHIVTDYKNIADAFANCFKSDLYFVSFCHFIVLPTAHVSFAEVSKPVRRLKPSMCVGADGIPYFVIKWYSLSLFHC